MPVTNTQGSFSTGRDARIVIIAGSGRRVDLPNLTSWDAKQDATDVKVKRMDGLRLHGMLPDGWSGTFDNERSGPALDDLFAEQEVLWLDGGVIQNGTIYQYVLEPNGSTSTYEFSNVAFKMDNAGSYAADKSVAQKVSWSASRRRKV